jgi:hypothetical protein
LYFAGAKPLNEDNWLLDGTKYHKAYGPRSDVASEKVWTLSYHLKKRLLRNTWIFCEPKKED